ncbi:hypothetical protein SAY86_020511 [Trapa natans]|uniref:Uncharacterized protein n=1 Tax=Trapa natans TaxID=22666 RepID=A0AAN7LNC7_TRANT|nr:hypothetical protein SAY86_020511 [Trapa natans]
MRVKKSTKMYRTLLTGKSFDYVRFSLIMKPPISVLYFHQLLGEPGTGGSSTPSMVGAVKKWQKSDPQKSIETWKVLSEANASLEKKFNLLSKLAKDQWDEYRHVIDRCSRMKAEKVLCNLNCPFLEPIELIHDMFCGLII